MSLIKKIFLAFGLLVVIAVATGAFGLRTVSGMNNTLNVLVDYEMSANSLARELDTALQSITVAQRSLLNSALTDADRTEQHALVAAERAHIADLASRTTALLRRGASVVEGWNDMGRQWAEVDRELQQFLASSDTGEAMVREWEATTIINPDSLLRSIQGYRGDHYALATRMGDMVFTGRASGPEVSDADDLCAFGRWRVNFDAGKEAFSANPAIKKAMQSMTEPHRDFHRTAHEIYAYLSQNNAAGRSLAAESYRAHLRAAEQVIGTFQQITDEAERARLINNNANTFVMGDLRSLRSAVREHLGVFASANALHMEKAIGSAIADGGSGVVRMEALALGGLVLGLAIMILLYRSIRVRLTRPLGAVIAGLVTDAGEVATEARGVSTAAEALSGGSSRQAASLEETSAAIEEITSMARRNLENAQAANTSMQENARQIADSSEAMNRMSTAMAEIKHSSEQIGHILKTIEEIAFQTNLLALNAAVEAARAGEAGKGFAVVADEVRSLAQRSAQAVQDTSVLITGTVERVDNGVRISGEIETLFSRISDTTRKIVQMISEIDVATGEQTQGMEQINTAVQQIDQVNQENARHAEGNAAASVNLTERSANLMAMIDELGLVMTNIVGKGRGVTASAGQGRNGKGEVIARIVPNRALKSLPPPRGI